MIPQKLLTAKGTIEAILHLTFGEDDATVSDLSDAMDVADGTARERLEALHDLGLVTEDADLKNGRPVRVYTITEDGVSIGEALNEILEAPYIPPETEPTGEDPDGTVDVATGDEETVEADQ